MADTCLLTKCEVILEMVYSHVLLGCTFYFLIVDVWQDGDTAETKEKGALQTWKTFLFPFD